MPSSCPEVDKEFDGLIPLQAADKENNTVAADLVVVSLELDGISTCRGTTKTCTKRLFDWERLLFFSLYMSRFGKTSNTALARLENHNCKFNMRRAHKQTNKPLQSIIESM